MRGRKVEGVTLIELLIVMGLVTLMMVVVSALFLQGRDALKLSTNKVDTAGRARRALDAMTPIAMSGVRADGSDALAAHDLTPEVLTDECYLQVTSREDFLNPEYVPWVEYHPLTAGPPFRFRILYEPVKQTLTLVQLEEDSDEVNDDVSPRLLARDIAGCGFRRLSEGTVAVTLVAEGEPDPRRPDGATSTKLEGMLAAPGR